MPRYKSKKDVNPNLEWILGFNKWDNKDVPVGLINHENKTVKHCFGFYPPAKQSYRVAKIARKLNYTLKP